MRILELEMVTLINILNAKGVIYTHYKLKKERESYERDPYNKIEVSFESKMEY